MVNFKISRRKLLSTIELLEKILVHKTHHEELFASVNQKRYNILHIFFFYLQQYQYVRWMGIFSFLKQNNLLVENINLYFYLKKII